MRTTIAGMPSAQYYRQQFLKHRDKINKRNRERMAQWRIDNPDKEKERQRLWQKRYGRMNTVLPKWQAIQKYGGKCACCGETFFECLTLDHIKPVMRNSRFDHKISYRKVRREPHDPNLQVLCFNCNSMKGTGPCCPHFIEALLSA